MTEFLNVKKRSGSMSKAAFAGAITLQKVNKNSTGFYWDSAIDSKGHICIWVELPLLLLKREMMPEIV